MRFLLVVAIPFFVLFAPRNGFAQPRSAVREMRQATGLQGSDAERVTRITMEVMGPLMNDPAFRQAMMQDPRIRNAGSQAEANGAARVVGAELSARGMLRLSAPDLLEWHRLRQLVARDANVCAAVAEGNAQGVGAGLARLGDADLRSWMSISARAMQLEIRAERPLQRVSLDSFVPQMMSAVTVPQRARMQRAGEPNATPADHCFVLRRFFAHAESLSGARKVRFLRALATLGAPS